MSIRHPRKGNFLVITALLMVSMMVLLALTVDLGYMYAMRAQLQRSADASAIAAAWELLDEDAQLAADLTHAVAQARTSAQNFAGMNNVGNTSPSLGSNDVIIGYRSNIFDLTEPITLLNSDQSNTVRVLVRRDATQNGEIPFFFARAFGFETTSLQADATAALLTGFKGFGAPPGNQNLMLLPFALDKDTWDDLRHGIGEDNWTWHDDGTITPGADNILEVNLYPQGTGSPGNRGTVDIGSSNNSTSDICRQILEGISESDLDYHGGTLEIDPVEGLDLNADTGISAGFKDELASIKGQPRIIPVFDDLSGNGNNATYHIVHWAGIRIMYVKLTGPMRDKAVIVQPACIKIRGGIPADPGDHPSDFIYSPVVLVE